MANRMLLPFVLGGLVAMAFFVLVILAAAELNR